MWALTLEFLMLLHICTVRVNDTMVNGLVPGMLLAANVCLKILMLDSTLACLQLAVAYGILTAQPCLRSPVYSATATSPSTSSVFSWTFSSYFCISLRVFTIAGTRLLQWSLLILLVRQPCVDKISCNADVTEPVVLQYFCLPS